MSSDQDNPGVALGQTIAQITAVKKSIKDLEDKVETAVNDVYEGEQRLAFCQNNLKFMRSEADIVSLEEYVATLATAEANRDILHVMREDLSKYRANLGKQKKVLPKLEAFKNEISKEVFKTADIIPFKKV